MRKNLIKCTLITKPITQMTVMYLLKTAENLCLRREEGRRMAAREDDIRSRVQPAQIV